MLASTFKNLQNSNPVQPQTFKTSSNTFNDPGKSQTQETLGKQWKPHSLIFRISEGWTPGSWLLYWSWMLLPARSHEPVTKLHLKKNPQKPIGFWILWYALVYQLHGGLGEWARGRAEIANASPTLPSGTSHAYLIYRDRSVYIL